MRPVDMTMNYSLTVNGIGHAFLREFGCSCLRCTSKGQAATTSVSLIGREANNKAIAWHALIDVGPGVTDSLCNIFPPQEARLDWLLFTHWHPDHSLDLNRLCESMRRTARRRGGKFSPIPTWCRYGTAKWLQKNYSYEWYRCLSPKIVEENELPGLLLREIPLQIEGLCITPITVSHAGGDISADNFKEKSFNCASFIVETKQRKAIFLWDLDNRNNWVANPASAEQEQAVDRLSDADYLYVDCLSWNVEEVMGMNTGHLAFASVRNYARILRPKVTFLVHMSGHEEGEDNPGYGWSDQRWAEEAQTVWNAEGLPGAVRIPIIGEELPL
jgi:ribonuclease BN (tRNA processing enzyme)